MTVCSSCEIARCSGKRSGDNPADSMFAAHYLPCLFTDLIKFLKWNDLLMSSDLKDAVSRGIDYQVTGLHVLFAVIPDNIRSAVRFVAKETFSGCLAELCYYLIGEPVRICRLRLI